MEKLQFGKGVPYTPFKMSAAAFGNSPMLKNFGIGNDANFGVSAKESAADVPSPNRFMGFVVNR